jgi:hypothetical protein
MRNISRPVAPLAAIFSLTYLLSGRFKSSAAKKVGKEVMNDLHSLTHAQSETSPGQALVAPLTVIFCIKFVTVS